MNSSTYRTSASELGGGRLLLLLFLFALALYQFINVGFNAFATICMLPAFVLGIIMVLKYEMLVFWILTVLNYLLMWHSMILPQGVPVSLLIEALEILLLVKAVINVKDEQFSRCGNLMFFALIVWSSFCTLEVLNNTCGLGINIGTWYTGARLMAFQLVYAFVVFSIYITNPKVLINYLYLWAVLALFAVFWVWKQQHIGLTSGENEFLQGRGRTTHIINGGATIRYFSIYNDAASYGIGIASTAVAFLIIGFTSKVKKHKFTFLFVGIACLWGMMPSGTRTATFCVLAGIATYVILSKSFKIATTTAILLGLAYFFIAFTTIGNGNAQIRRMRSGFNKNDASANTRTINQAVMKKYLAEAPFGLGIGMGYDNVPPNNKYRRLSAIPPDSEYVFIWIHTGIVGITVFIITTLIMFFGASYIVMFRLRSPSLRGLGAGLCCAFVSMQLGGYANQVLMQFPNCLVFYGALSLVYALPHMEEEWIKYEEKLLAVQKEKEQLKLEKKRA